MSNTAASATKLGEKASSFLMTCNLLSQYMKEKGRSLGDLGLGMPPRPVDSTNGKSDSYRPLTTMSLLPGVAVSEENASERNDAKSMDLFPQLAGSGLQTPAAADGREPKKSQLTIFYGGKVLVFDNFPEDKAEDLMKLADKGCGGAMNTGFVAPPPVASAATVEPNNLSANAPETVQVSSPRPPPTIVSAGLPIARKASLHRFLEKRKDRINAKAPYLVKDSADMVATPKKEVNQPWLALNPSTGPECKR